MDMDACSNAVKIRQLPPTRNEHGSLMFRIRHVLRRRVWHNPTSTLWTLPTIIINMTSKRIFSCQDDDKRVPVLMIGPRKCFQLEGLPKDIFAVIF